MSPSIKNIRRHFREVLRTKKSAHSIALGAALGTLIGTLPIPFIDFVIALLVVLLFKKVSKYSLFAAVIFWNPITKVPIYTMSYVVGDMLFGAHPVVPVELSLWSRVYTYSRRFLIGNLIISIVLTAVVYVFTYVVVVAVKRYRRQSQKN